MPLAIYLEREKDTATSLALAAVLIGLSFVIVGATNIDWGRVASRLMPRHADSKDDDAAWEPGTLSLGPNRGERTPESPRTADAARTAGGL